MDSPAVGPSRRVVEMSAGERGIVFEIDGGGSVQRRLEALGAC